MNMKYELKVKNEGAPSSSGWNVYLKMTDVQGFENGYRFEASNGIMIIKSNEMSLTTYGIFFDNCEEMQIECITFPNEYIAQAYKELYRQALEEMMYRLKDNNWYPRCDYRNYWYINSNIYISQGKDEACDWDNHRHEQYNIFYTDKFTLNQLMDDNVPRMSKLERIAYLYAHYHDIEWLSDRERLTSGNGYSVYTNIDCPDSKKIYLCPQRVTGALVHEKWFAHEVGCKAFCEWANRNIDWRGNKRNENTL